MNLAFITLLQCQLRLNYLLLPIRLFVTVLAGSFRGTICSGILLPLEIFVDLVDPLIPLSVKEVAGYWVAQIVLASKLLDASSASSFCGCTAEACFFEIYFFRLLVDKEGVTMKSGVQRRCWSNVFINGVASTNPISRYIDHLQKLLLK